MFNQSYGFSRSGHGCEDWTQKLAQEMSALNCVGEDWSMDWGDPTSPSKESQS